MISKNNTKELKNNMASQSIKPRLTVDLQTLADLGV
ncbi:MAG: hypothetical protein RI918_1614, partial [Pseudomonadota bacterium]